MLEFLHDLLDGPVELLVFAVPFLDRVVVYHDIRIYAMVLNNPIPALRIEAGEEGHADVGPINVGKRTADADNATPGAGTNQFAQLQGLETPREKVAIRGGIFVDETNLRTDLYRIGHRSYAVRAAAHRKAVGLAGQTLQNHGRDISASIGAVVDDKPFLIKLWVEVAGKFVEAVGSHIRDVDVTYFAVGRLFHLAEVVLHPIIMIERVLFGERRNYYLVGTFELRTGEHPPCRRGAGTYS